MFIDLAQFFPATPLQPPAAPPPPDQLTQPAPDAAAGVRYVNMDLHQFGTPHPNTKAMKLSSKDEPTYKLRKLMKLI
jgi:hypothetical protein